MITEINFTRRFYTEYITYIFLSLIRSKNLYVFERHNAGSLYLKSILAIQFIARIATFKLLSKDEVAYWDERRIIKLIPRKEISIEEVGG